MPIKYQQYPVFHFVCLYCCWAIIYEKFVIFQDGYASFRPIIFNLLAWTIEEIRFLEEEEHFLLLFLIFLREKKAVYFTIFLMFAKVVNLCGFSIDDRPIFEGSDTFIFSFCVLKLVQEPLKMTDMVLFLSGHW